MSTQADAVLEALGGFAIGDTVGHSDMPGDVGTIVRGPSQVVYEGLTHDIWIVEWPDCPGRYMRYFHFNIFHVQA